MATAREESTRQSPWPARVVVLAGVLFPLLVTGGVLAPRVISLMADPVIESTATEAESPATLDFSKPLPGKPPLLLPRDYDAGFVPELLDLQNLFSAASHTADQMAEEYARLLGFPRSHGDVIVMDDVDREIRDVIFKDPVMVGAETAYPRRSLRFPSPERQHCSLPDSSSSRFDTDSADPAGGYLGRTDRIASGSPQLPLRRTAVAEVIVSHPRGARYSPCPRSAKRTAADRRPTAGPEIIS